MVIKRLVLHIVSCFYRGIVYYSFRKEFKSSSFFINAVKENTGEVLWALELPGLRPNRVYSSSGLVYVSVFKEEGQVPNALNNGFYKLTAAYIYAINASTGKLVWKFKGGHVGYSSPPLTIGSKYIYFTSREGLYALDKSTGKPPWFLESPGTPPWFFDGRFSSYNIVESGFLYVNGGRGDNHIYAINPQSGEIVWSYEDDNLWNTKVIDDVVYVSAQDSQVAINSSTGKKLWKFKTGGFFNPGTNVSATPTIFKNHVIFPMETKTFFGQESILRTSLQY